MFVKNIDKNIQEALKAKERAFAKKTSGTNDSVDTEGTLKFSDMASRTVFVRMISNKEKPVIIQGGRLTEDESGALKTVFGKQLYKKDSNGEVRSTSGIKDISIEYKGQYKAIRTANINWIASSLDELNELMPHFLTPGKTILIDWGWTYKNKPFPTTFLTSEGKIDSTSFSSPSKLIKESNGEYDAIAGSISNFNYSLNEDGTFNCSTTVTSLGVNLFQNITVDKSPMPLQKSPDITKESDTSISTFRDGLINSIINLPRIILHDVWQIPYNSKLENTIPDGAQGSNKKTYAAGRLSKYFNPIGEKSNSKWHVPPMVDISKSNNWSTNNAKYIDPRNLYVTLKKDYKVFQPEGSRDHDDIMFAKSTFKDNTREDWFVRWGWFEDNILSRYSTLVNDKGDLSNQFRSINNVMRDGNLSYEPVKIRNNKALKFPVDIFKFILPGQVPDKNLFMNPDISGINETSKNYDYIINHLSTDVLLVNADTKPFKDKSDENLGILRNVMINVTEIQKAFGIKNPDTVNEMLAGNIIGPELIEPVATISEGILNLAKALSENYHNFWDFKIVNDTDTSRIKLIDAKSTNIESYNYSEFEENSHKITKHAIYKFPTFQMNSIVKSQNLESKIPDAVTATIVYGSNSPEKDKLNLDLTHEQPELKLLFSQNKDPVFKDSYLEGIGNAYIKGRGVPYRDTSKIGAISKDLKITFEGSFAINHDAKWWSSWSETDNDFKKEIEENESAGYEETFSFLKTDVSPELKSAIDDIGNEPSFDWDIINSKEPKKSWNMLETFLWDITGGDKNKLKDLSLTEEQKKIEIKKIVTQAIESVQNKEGPAFYFLTNSSDDDDPFQVTIIASRQTFIKEKLFYRSAASDIYKSDFIYPIDLSLTLDGTSGIFPGDCIQSDYMPERYNKDYKGFGPFAFFQIVELTQKIDSSGWETEISTIMRSNHNALDAFVQEKRDEETVKPPENNLVELDPEEVYDSSIIDTNPLKDFSEFEPYDLNIDFDELDEFDLPEAPPKRPKTPVPSDDEDIAGDLTLEELEFDDFSQLEPPPPIPEPVVIEVFKKKEEQEPEPEPIPIVSTKVEVRPVKPVYVGSYNQNELLYSQREDWRPIYKRPNGTLTGERKTDGVSNTQVRSALTKSKRAEYYHQFIEYPNQTGKTVIQDLKSRQSYSVPYKAGMITRTNRDKWWKTPKDE